MKQINSVITLLAIFCYSLSSFSQTSSLVTRDSSGKLIYTPDSKGNIIPDFSMVGYHHGEIPIPNVPVKVTLTPKPGDRRADIINAINQVAAMPMDENGHKGAILLKAGYYEVSSTILFNKSGVVIRGEGKNANGTIIRLTATSKMNLFQMNGGGPIFDHSSTKTVVDDYVPIGSKTVTVEAGHTFQVGDRIYLKWMPNSDWISSIGMDQISEQCAPDRDWLPEQYVYLFKREVRAVNGNQLTLDAPAVQPLDPQYGTTIVFKYNNERLIREIGIENIRLESSYVSETDEDHGWDAIEMKHIENSWIKNMNAYYFAHSAVSARGGAYLITVEDCGMFEYKSYIVGGRRYGFSTDDCDLILFKNCKASQGRHDFVQGSKTPGPNVYFNCSNNTTYGDQGPHHRYSVGTLWDNIVTDSPLNLQNRLCSGSGHGWAGAQQVFWNCRSTSMILQDVEGDARNWAIGCITDEPITNVAAYTTKPLGIVESEGTHIADIPSLYEAQLRDRLAPNAPSNLTVSQQSNQIELSWTDNSTNEIEFIVERKEFGSWTTIATLDTNTTNFTDGNIPETYNYTYRITAIAPTVSSYPSNEVHVYVAPPSIYPVADAFIRNGALANNNYGTNVLAAKLASNQNGDGQREIVLQFDLTELPEYLETAKLRLTVTDTDINDFEAFISSNDNWTETGVTWNNAPQTENSLGIKTNTTENPVLEWDIKTAALQEKANDNVISIRIKSNRVNVFSILASKESANNEIETPAIVYKEGVAPPNAPSNLEATEQENQIDLTWTDLSDDEDAFIIERKENNIWSTLATVNANTTTYFDTNISTTYNYSYRVSSVSGINNSLPSNAVSVTNISISNSELLVIADAFIRGGTFANDNYGNDQLITKQTSTGDGNGQREIVLKFDLSTLPQNIQEATLKLTVKDADINDFEAFLVNNDNWTETGVTWNNAPQANTSLGIQTNSLENPVLKWNITTELLHEKATDQIISIRVKGLRGNIFSNIASKESVTNNSEKPSIIFETGTNLALNKPAIQSSTRFGGIATRAVDGNTDGNYNNLSVTHTAQSNEPWWEVDLGAIANISKIKVYNRTNCCSERLSNYHIFVSDTPFNFNTVSETQNQNGVNDFYEFEQAGSPTVRNINTTGRYVRIQLEGNSKWLNIAEIEVFGNFINNQATTSRRQANNIGFTTKSKNANKNDDRISTRSISNNIAIFPNPAKNSITIKNISKNSNVSIYNTSGILVLKTTNNNAINISNLANGLYIVVTASENKKQFSKFIKN